MLSQLNYKKQYYWLLLAIALMVIYFPSFTGPYVLDDAYTISTNPSIQSWSNWQHVLTSAKAYTSLPMTWTFRPMTSFSNLLMWSVGGGATWPFHLIKIFLFIPICFFIIQILKNVFPNVKEEVIYGLTFLYAINPVHTQVLSYISATSTLLAAFFVYAALFLKLKYDKNPKPQYLVFSLISVFLAILAKEEGVVVLAFVFLLDFYKNKKLSKMSFLYFIPVCLGLYLLVINFEPETATARSAVGPLSYFITQIRAYIRYIVMLVYSYDLNADNLEFGFSHSFKDTAVVIALILNVVIVSAAIYFWRLAPIVTLGVIWFYAGISPASSVVPLAEPVNDHRAFIGYVGLLFVLVYFLSRLELKNKKVFWSLLAVGSLIYGFQTYQRSTLWKSGVKIWEDTVAKNPSSPRALNNLALQHMRVSEYDKALEYLNKCAQLAHKYPFCRVNLGVVYSAIGADNEAIKSFDMALGLDFTYISSRINYAKFLNARGHYTQASKLLKEADEFTKGNHYNIRVSLIHTLAQIGHNQEALRLVDESIKKNGDKDSLQKLRTKLIN